MTRAQSMPRTSVRYCCPLHSDERAREVPSLVHRDAPYPLSTHWHTGGVR